jgi:hypothetical protein
VTYSPSMVKAMGIVHGARYTAIMAEMDHLERSGLAPSEAARAVRRVLPDDAALGRQAVAVACILDALEARLRSIEKIVDLLEALAGEPPALVSSTA